MACWYTFHATLGTTRVQVPAAGLHLYGSDQTFLLEKIWSDKQPPKLSLGRDKQCDIRLADDRSISGRHAVLERHEGSIWELLDDRSRNGLLINGEPMEGPTRLMLGMEIRIGRSTKLFTCDHNGLVPMGMLLSVDEMCHRAFEMFGTYVEVARRYDLGREFVRKHAERWTDQVMGEEP